MKKVAIYTCTYNRAYIIERTIQSVLSQTHTNFEYTIIDDASTDNTPELVASIKDPRVKFVRYETNETHAAQYPKTFRNWSGDYFMRIDSDDSFLSNTNLETMVRNLDTSPPDEWLHGYTLLDERTGKDLSDYFTGWKDGKIVMTFEDFLLGTKGYADILFIAKPVYVENFFKYYKRPFNWYTGLWEALQPDGKLVIFREPMELAGWGGTDNVSVFSGGKKFWGMCAEYNEYLAERYHAILSKAPRRLGYFYQWAAYYELLLGKKAACLKYLFKCLKVDPTNSRTWALLALWPLPCKLVLWALEVRSKLKWKFRTKGDWRT